MFGLGLGFGRKDCRGCLLGVAVGIGVAAAGYYLYKKNKTKVDAFLMQHVIKPECEKAKIEEKPALPENTAE